MRYLFNLSQFSNLVVNLQVLRAASIFTMFMCLLPNLYADDLAAPCVDRLKAQIGKRPDNALSCIDIREFEPISNRPVSQVLVVFIGDNDLSKKGISLSPAVASELSKRLNALTVTLQKSEFAKMSSQSSGNSRVANSFYSVEDVVMAAGELKRLRNLHVGKKILLIGHSGGAAVAAQLPGRFPESADAYLLVGCPCHQAQWRTVKANTRISLLVGTNDDDTPASFSQTYVAGLRAQGVKTRLTYAVGATHVSVLRSPEFFMLAEHLLSALAP